MNRFPIPRRDRAGCGTGPGRAGRSGRLLEEDHDGRRGLHDARGRAGPERPAARLGGHAGQRRGLDGPRHAGPGRRIPTSRPTRSSRSNRATARGRRHPHDGPRRNGRERLQCSTVTPATAGSQAITDYTIPPAVKWLSSGLGGLLALRPYPSGSYAPPTYVARGLRRRHRDDPVAGHEPGVADRRRSPARRSPTPIRWLPADSLFTMSWSRVTGRSRILDPRVPVRRVRATNEEKRRSGTPAPVWDGNVKHIFVGYVGGGATSYKLGSPGAQVLTFVHADPHPGLLRAHHRRRRRRERARMDEGRPVAAAGRRDLPIPSARGRGRDARIRQSAPVTGLTAARTFGPASVAKAAASVKGRAHAALPSCYHRGMIRGASILALALVLVRRAAAGAGPTPPGARAFGIARLKYGGGGDWYGDQTSLRNLMAALRTAHLASPWPATTPRWSSPARRRSSSTRSCSPRATATCASPTRRFPTCGAGSMRAASCGWTTTSASRPRSGAR